MIFLCNSHNPSSLKKIKINNEHMQDGMMMSFKLKLKLLSFELRTISNS